MKILEHPQSGRLNVLLLVGLSSLSLVRAASVQGATFFRIVAPWTTAITSLSPDGTITWTNGATGTNCVIQIATDLNQNAWADYIQVPVSNVVVNERLFDPAPPAGMVLIPAGNFSMGDSLDRVYDALPVHTVYVSAFYMDQYDVTEALWSQVYNWATNHGYSFHDPGSVYDGFTKGPNYPVVDVNWYDVVKWCNARSEMEGRAPAYYTDASQTTVYRTGDIGISSACVNWNGGGYRLPTEAEWEKAARGGLSGQRFPWGNTINESQANYYAHPSGYSYDVNTYSGCNTNFDTGSSPYTSPVNYFSPNGYGLYDMAGNVWQWCWDRYDRDWYANEGATVNDTRGPTSSLYGLRVLRGGGWGNRADGSRCAYRDYGYGVPGRDNSLLGFRCVRGL